MLPLHVGHPAASSRSERELSSPQQLSNIRLFRNVFCQQCCRALQRTGKSALRPATTISSPPITPYASRNSVADSRIRPLYVRDLLSRLVWDLEFGIGPVLCA